MEQKIIEYISRLKRLCAKNDDAIMDKLDLSPAEFNGLMAIMPEEIISSKQLSKNMGLSTSRGSRVICKLLEKEFLQQQVNQKDKRYINISITKKGIKFQNEIRKMYDKCEDRIIQNLKADEIRIIKRCLNKLIGLL